MTKNKKYKYPSESLIVLREALFESVNTKVDSNVSAVTAGNGGEKVIDPVRLYKIIDKLFGIDVNKLFGDISHEKEWTEVSNKIKSLNIIGGNEYEKITNFFKKINNEFMNVNKSVDEVDKGVKKSISELLSEIISVQYIIKIVKLFNSDESGRLFEPLIAQIVGGRDIGDKNKIIDITDIPNGREFTLKFISKSKHTSVKDKKASLNDYLNTNKELRYIFLRKGSISQGGKKREKLDDKTKQKMEYEFSIHTFVINEENKKYISAFGGNTAGNTFSISIPKLEHDKEKFDYKSEEIHLNFDVETYAEKINEILKDHFTHIQKLLSSVDDYVMELDKFLNKSNHSLVPAAIKLQEASNNAVKISK